MQTMHRRFSKEGVFDYQTYKHRQPEFDRLIHLHDNVKQAHFLNQASLMTSMSGFARCKESMIEVKIKNIEKIKLKSSEHQTHE